VSPADDHLRPIIETQAGLKALREVFEARWKARMEELEVMNRTAEHRADVAEAKVVLLREAIIYLFTPGPGIAVPEKHDNDWGDPAKITWNKKIDRLRAVAGLEP
jgi:hypothetical protein